MVTKRIAIIGSAHPNRKDELGLENIERASIAGEEIGFALAEGNYCIDVYASSEYMFEVDVVRGYAKSEKASKRSIRVCFPIQGDVPHFLEEGERGILFDPEPDRSNSQEWEVSFYDSIADVDGVILLGGGNSTLIAGLIALGHKKPIVCLAMFGGAAKKVWKVLGVQKDFQIDEDDWDNMGFTTWSSDLATELIRALDRQFLSLENAEKQETIEHQNIVAKEIQQVHEHYINQTIRSKQARLFAFITIPLLLAIFILWGYSQAVSVITVEGMYTILLFSPLAGGIVGASIRVVFNEFQGKTNHKIPDIVQNTTLGLFSGGIAAALFITAQTASLNSLELSPAELAQQLKPLVFNAAIIGIFGGVAIDAVFARIQSSDPLNPSTFLPASSTLPLVSTTTVSNVSQGSNDEN